MSWQEKKMGVSNQDEQTGTDTSSGLEQAEGNEVDELREPYLLEDLLSASSALTKRILLTLDELAVLRHLSDALCRQAEQEGGDD
ncbi:MAG: hypothetical protein NXI28_15915 [bacterium]|nr:hypothetical protein [bacterium]